MSRVVEHVPQSGFEEYSAPVGEIARGFLRVSVDVEKCFTFLDCWERRRCPDDRLLLCRGVHFEVLDPARN
jgi:hypothetical protein